MLIYLAVLCGQGVGVALWPYRWTIACWALWAIPASVFALFIGFGGETPRDHPHPDPAWPGIAPRPRACYSGAKVPEPLD